MLTINLREIYYWCTEDTFVEVTEEMFEAMRAADRQQEAYRCRTRYHKAYYSLDCNDGIENYAMYRSHSPEEVYIHKESKRELSANIALLPEIQQRRLKAYYFYDLKKCQIAELEGVSPGSVSSSVKNALKNLKTLICNDNSKKSQPKTTPTPNNITQLIYK